jgi:hypothetical protein
MAGAFPELIPPTVAAIEAAVEAAARERRFEGSRISASSLGEECERRLWYAFRWVHDPEQFEGRILRLFDTGNVYEDRIVAWLRMAGMTVAAVDPETGEQFRVVFADRHASGRTDGEVIGVPEAPKTPHLLECKSHNDKSFAQLKKHGVEASKPVHYAQCQIYMHKRGLTRALYIGVNKNDDHLYVERIEYDPAEALRLEAKAERIVAADVPPRRLFDDPDERMAFKCRSCPALAVCHHRAFARRSCRTCIHSTPVDGGKWECALHGELSMETQAAGCPDHLYLPELVPGEQVDADEKAHTVTYTLDGGEAFVDGWREPAA